VARSAEETFARIVDPAVLAAVIPGCRSLDARDDARFTVCFEPSIAPMLGAFESEVRLADVVVPQRCRLELAGHGAAGTLDGTADIRLDPQPDGGTLVRYTATFRVGGLLGTFGKRYLQSAAKDRSERFFAALDEGTGAR